MALGAMFRSPASIAARSCADAVPTDATKATARWLMRSRFIERSSFVVLTHVFLAVVIREAFGAGNTAAPDNSGLQIGDNGVDLLRS